jgi:hypothetical protein
MRKPVWKFLVDNLLIVCTLAMAVVGVLFGLVIPEGPAAGERSNYFPGLHRHEWGHIHAYLAIAFVVLLVVHLVLLLFWFSTPASTGGHADRRAGQMGQFGMDLSGQPWSMPA